MSTVLSVTYSPDGKLIASVHADKRVRLRDACSGQVKQILEGEMDQYPEQAFYMVGGREDVERRASELTKEDAA